MKTMKIVDDKRVIELINYSPIGGKDIIEVKHWEDFEYLSLDYNCIYKWGKSYYLIDENKVYICKEVSQ